MSRFRERTNFDDSEFPYPKYGNDLDFDSDHYDHHKKCNIVI